MIVGLGFRQVIRPSVVLAIVEHVGNVGFFPLQIGQILLEWVKGGDDGLLVGFRSGSWKS